MMPSGMIVTAPLNVMTYDTSFSCGGWMNQPSYAYNAIVTFIGTNQICLYSRYPRYDNNVSTYVHTQSEE